MVVHACTYLLAWRGPCGAPTTGIRCALHVEHKCHCGAVATHECSQTMGAAICGAPLCDEHEHGRPIELCSRFSGEVGDHDESPGNQIDHQDDEWLRDGVWRSSEEWLQFAAKWQQFPVDLWPVWERDCLKTKTVHTLGVTHRMQRCAAEKSAPDLWRPLWLPGMDEHGIIKASDMTDAYFERVRKWQWRDNQMSKWVSHAPGEDARLRELELDECPDHEEIWRPAIFARLDEHERNESLG